MNDEQRPERYGDYLQALAFRILHQESVLQPRRAALFETESAESNEYEEPVRFEMAELLRPAPLAPPAAIPQTPIAVAAAAEPRSRQEERVDGVQVAGAPAPPAPRRSIDAVGTESGRERVPLVLEPAPQIETQRRTADPPQAVTLLDPSISHEPRRERRLDPSGVVAAATAAVQPRVVPVREKSISVESSALPVRIAEPPNQAVMLARMVPETRNLSPLFKPAPSAPQDETTVEITIGRLEIRAVSAPSAVPPKTAPPPGYSLKEYLTRNAGGRT